MLPFLFSSVHVNFLLHVGKQSAVTYIPLPVLYTEWEVEAAEGEALCSNRQMTNNVLKWVWVCIQVTGVYPREADLPH